MQVLCQLWDESEAGWGVKPDGYSLHRTQEDLNAYIDAHWASYKRQYGNKVPSCYDRPSGDAYFCEVSQEVYGTIKGNGIRCEGQEPERLRNVLATYR